MEGYELRVDGFARITEPWDTHFLKTSSPPGQGVIYIPFHPHCSPEGEQGDSLSSPTGAA